MHKSSVLFLIFYQAKQKNGGKKRFFHYLPALNTEMMRHLYAQGESCSFGSKWYKIELHPQS